MTRERSLWGWGWDDKLPDEAARRALGAQVAAMLGLDALDAPLSPRALPGAADARVPDPRIAVPVELAAFATADRIERARHTYGKSYPDLLRGFDGDFRAAPDFVLRPRDEDDVAATLRWCEQARVAAIPFGGGTSVVGGVEPIAAGGQQGAVSIDMRAMDRVLEVDLVSRAARIQAGALGPAIESQLAVHGLSLRHFPQSFEFSTLGGWIATRAGGHFATLHTHIDDLVEAVRMVTPRGVFASRRVPASGAGPSPDRIVLGSEGILGVVTEAWMRVVPRPKWRASASVFFDDFFAGAHATRAVAQSGLHPANCRLLDAREALLNGVPTDGGAVLLLGFESADHPLDAWIARAVALSLAHGGRCPNGVKLREGDGDRAARAGDASSETWRSAFLDAPYLQSALVSLGVIADTFETACTWEKFEALHAAVTHAVTDAFARVSGGKGSLTCRFTHVYPDGPAPYFTFVTPARSAHGASDVRATLAQWSEIKRAASDALAENGATITHHHAVGRTHRPWYDRERPELFAEALRGAKRALDPAAILNPGVLIDARPEKVERARDSF
jgi:alkyldihydroxyacetonephosphate synthase